MSTLGLSQVTRNNLFYNEQEYQYESELVMGYLEEDLNQTVIVYEVDRTKTSTNLYNESENVRVLNKIEIPCMYEIAEGSLRTYEQQKGKGAFAMRGNLTIYTTNKTLEKYACNIKRGDYIGVLVDNDRFAYFSVVDDGKVNLDNKKNIGAYRLSWLKITASPITKEEFDGE